MPLIFITAGFTDRHGGLILWVTGQGGLTTDHCPLIRRGIHGQARGLSLRMMGQGGLTTDP